VNVDELRKLQRVDASAISQKKKLSEMDVLAVVQNDSTYLQQAEGVKYYRKPFEFLSLGIMAYVGNDRALTQVGGWVCRHSGCELCVQSVGHAITV
jgi:hypothetical protein